MRRLLSVSLLLLLVNTGLRAQQYTKSPEYLRANGNWVFYDSIGLNFNDRSNFGFSPKLTGNIVIKGEGAASASDPATGTLLFYSNGGSCWDKNHALMPNGANLLGNGPELSTNQGVCIVPAIGDSKLYYLFSLSSGASVGINSPIKASKLYYSIVDMSLNNGAGDIVAGKKNILLDSALLSEAMIAIPGNNCDNWLMTHAVDSALFKAYHITADGVQAQPVLSRTGTQIQGAAVGTAYSNLYNVAAYQVAAMAVSPDRQRIAITSYNPIGFGFMTQLSATGRTNGSLLADFDPVTGKVSNSILLDTSAAYSAAFSPDNSKLYLCYLYNANTPVANPASVYQFDLAGADTVAIKASKTKIELTGLSGSSDLFSLKTYNDTIYLLRQDKGVIDRINQPNIKGNGCGYEHAAITLPARSFISPIGYSLPNEVVYPPTFLASSDTAICEGKLDNGVALKPEIGSGDYVYEWNDASTNKEFTIKAAGTYWVKYNNGCQFKVDTFIIHDLESPAPVITVDEFVLGTALKYVSYQWLKNEIEIPGATSSTLIVEENADYQVFVTDSFGCTAISDKYNVTNVRTGINDFLHSNSVKVYPNPATDKVTLESGLSLQQATISIYNVMGQKLMTQTQLKGKLFQLDFKGYASGMYVVEVQDGGDTVRMKVSKQ